MDSHVYDVYGMKTDKQFVNTFEDIIRQLRAMDRLISNSAQVETRGRAKDILRAYIIGNWQIEADQQYQYPVERKYRYIKSTTNRLLERSGSPANTWFLCFFYVCILLNRITSSTLGWRTPIECLTGTTPAISVLLHFHWR